MAQSAEHILGKDEVPGSNPGISSRQKAPLHLFAMGRFYVLKNLDTKPYPSAQLCIFAIRKRKSRRQPVFYRRDLISVL